MAPQPERSLGDQVRYLVAKAMNYRLYERPDHEILDDLLASLGAFAVDLDRRDVEGD